MYFVWQGFVVNVIQFRNSFDSQGPGVPGVRPAEAVARLQDFQQRYTQFEAKRKTLDSVQLLFGIVPTPFHELDKTGEVGCFLFVHYSTETWLTALHKVQAFFGALSAF